MIRQFIIQLVNNFCSCHTATNGKVDLGCKTNYTQEVLDSTHLTGQGLEKHREYIEKHLKRSWSYTQGLPCYYWLLSNNFQTFMNSIHVATCPITGLCADRQFLGLTMISVNLVHGSMMRARKSAS